MAQGGHPLQTAAQGTPPPGISTPAPPHQPPLSASEGIGGARGLGNLVRPESHPEPRGFPVQWADPGVKPAIKTLRSPRSPPRPLYFRGRARVCRGRAPRRVDRALFAPFHRPNLHTFLTIAITCYHRQWDYHTRTGPSLNVPVLPRGHIVALTSVHVCASLFHMGMPIRSRMSQSRRQTAPLARRVA